jgi:hypothetical protein
MFLYYQAIAVVSLLGNLLGLEISREITKKNNNLRSGKTVQALNNTNDIENGVNIKLNDILKNIQNVKFFEMLDDYVLPSSIHTELKIKKSIYVHTEAIKSVGMTLASQFNASFSCMKLGDTFDPTTLW